MGVKGSLGIPAGGPVALQHGKPSGRTGRRLATTDSNSAPPFEEAGAVRALALMRAGAVRAVALASCRKAHGFAAWLGVVEVSLGRKAKARAAAMKWSLRRKARGFAAWKALWQDGA